MIVREVTEKDIPQIIHLGGRMHEESQYSALDFNPATVATMCYQIIDSEDMVGFVAVSGKEVVGMMSADVAPYLYGHELIAKDMLLYVQPEHRGSMAFLEMIKEYENWAFIKGAKLVFLSQTSGIDVEKVNKLYSRLGYDMVGGIHTKVMI